MALDDTISEGQAGHIDDHETIAKMYNQAVNLLSSTKASADTPDDEFTETTLDVKWTAVSGSSGTVDPLIAGSTVTEVYDLSSRPGWLLLQCGTADSVSLRQDYTLPDGASIVLAVSMPTGENSGGDNQSMALRLNDSNTSSTAGEHVTIMIEQDSTAFNIQGNSDTDASGTEITSNVAPLADMVFLRIMRSTLTYSCWYSMDGYSWSFVFEDTHADVADNVWITFVGATTLDYAPIAAIPWIRQGTNDLDPWSLGTS